MISLCPESALELPASGLPICICKTTLLFESFLVNSSTTYSPNHLDTDTNTKREEDTGVPKKLEGKF